MKKVVLIFVLVLNALTAQNIETELKTLNNHPDEFKGMIFYTPYPGGQWYNSTIYFYFGGNEKEVFNGRVVLQYIGNNWIFFDKVNVLIDKELYNFYGKVDRKVLGNGNVSEKMDIDVTTNTDILEALRKMGSAKEVKVRFEGKYVHDMQMQSQQLATINKYFSIYDKYRPVLKTPENILTEPLDTKGQVGLFVFCIGVLIVIIFVMVRSHRAKNVNREYVKYLENKYRNK